MTFYKKEAKVMGDTPASNEDKATYVKAIAKSSGKTIEEVLRGILKDDTAEAKKLKSYAKSMLGVK